MLQLVSHPAPDRWGGLISSPRTLTCRRSSTGLSSSGGANGLPSRASTELSSRRPGKFPQARYVDFSSKAAVQSRRGRGNSTCRSGGTMEGGGGHGASGVPPTLDGACGLPRSAREGPPA
ncbi:hypothetical protein PVAP13_5KG258107 [Panicum virgatum]|uniref:Uncharacterized protein n=1 Tax=Panicum virgatum TaxID=38727 RepID=A0A8T0SFX3_PANVG|nr:hypothetical protein PVAP13_5KG258107 [Panicum virgatum]